MPNAVADPTARRHELDAQIRRLGKRRNLIGGGGAGSGGIVAVGALYLRSAWKTGAMSQPMLVAAIVMLGAAVLGAGALGWYAVQLNNRIERLSAELTMLEMRG